MATAEDMSHLTLKLSRSSLLPCQTTLRMSFGSRPAAKSIECTRKLDRPEFHNGKDGCLRYARRLSQSTGNAPSKVCGSAPGPIMMTDDGLPASRSRRCLVTTDRVGSLMGERWRGGGSVSSSETEGCF